MQSHGIYCRSFAILQLSCAEAACNWAKHSGAEGAWETQPYGTRDACDRVVRSKRGGVSRGGDGVSGWRRGLVGVVLVRVRVRVTVLATSFALALAAPLPDAPRPRFKSGCRQAGKL